MGSAIDKILILASLGLSGVALRKVSVMGQKLQDLEGVLGQIDEHTNVIAENVANVAADEDRMVVELTSLRDQLATVQGQLADGATPTDLDAIIAKAQARADALRAQADNLKLVAAKVEDPIPPAPPVVPDPNDTGSTSGTDGSSSSGSTDGSISSSSDQSPSGS